MSQAFFWAHVPFASFGECEQLVIRATHSNHQLSPEVCEQVRQRFASYAGPDGVRFEQPMRVDLLRRRD